MSLNLGVVDEEAKAEDWEKEEEGCPESIAQLL